MQILFKLIWQQCDLGRKGGGDKLQVLLLTPLPLSPLPRTKWSFENQHRFSPHHYHRKICVATTLKVWFIFHSKSIFVW